MSEKLFDKAVTVFIILAYLTILVFMLMSPPRGKIKRLEEKTQQQSEMIKQQGELLDSLAAIVYN